MVWFAIASLAISCVGLLIIVRDLDAAFDK